MNENDFVSISDELSTYKLNPSPLFSRHLQKPRKTENTEIHYEYISKNILNGKSGLG